MGGYHRIFGFFWIAAGEVCLFVSLARARLWNGNGFADLRFANVSLVSTFTTCVFTLGVVTPAGD